jgi:DNA-binding MarR family transcriptional regulator
MLALWQEDNVMIKNLVERTRFDAGTLTPILKRLQQKGVLDLKKSEQDSRQKVVVVTEEGRALAQVAESIPDALSCQIDLTLEDAIALKQLSEKLYKTITEPKVS